MANVDFSDLESLTAWFQQKSPKMRSALSSRAALRVVSNVRLASDAWLTLLSLRAAILSTVLGLDRPQDKELGRAARACSEHSARLSVMTAGSHSAALSSFSAATRSSAASESSHSAALAITAAHSAASRSAIHSGTAHIAATSALKNDNQSAIHEFINRPLWMDAPIPEAIAANHATFLKYLEEDPDWAFWRRWYSEMWDGTFKDWDLAIKVAKLPNDLWEGEDALTKVADAIQEIEASRKDPTSFEGVQPEDVSTKSVSSLFQRAPVVQASMASMSEAISLRLDAFASLARPNERIQFVETLRAMPDTAQRICDILDQGADAPGAETALALEVGRLRAEVEQLKRDLTAAHMEIDELRKKPWFSKSGVVLAGGVLSALGVAIWTISEDSFEGEARWNNTTEELEFLWSKIQPEPQYTLPESVHLRFPDLEDE